VSDPGIQPPNGWSVDDVLVKATKDAVLSLRAKNEFGPRKRDRITFRASELGDLAAYRDARGEPGGCSRKTFFSFWSERFPARAMDAETLMNFAKGNEEQETMKRYLQEAGLYVEEEVRLGAWAGNMADQRFPDRSGGLVRGKCDFIIRHPQHGLTPLEWKSASTYIFDSIKKTGPKGDNALQAHYYGFEMGTSHVAIGYVNKENGEVVLFTAQTDTELIERVLARAKALREDIADGVMPDQPEGVTPPKTYQDRAWPCYYYAHKKKRVGACPFYEHCHGAPPAVPEDKPKRSARKKPAEGFTFE